MGIITTGNEPLGRNNNGGEQFIIVGIGASAGGITALKSFFEEVPSDSGMAYVVILHLSPDHDSKLAEVIRTSSSIPVFQVTERTRVEPNNVYVIAPNKHLEMADGHINVTTNIQIEDRRAPVDIFFRTLAESHGPQAVCVVLSGTGANGSMGLKRIKEMGGAAYVQNPREAEFNEMPRNSIATDLVDEVLPVADIPSHIINYKNSLGKVYIPTDRDDKPDKHQDSLRKLFQEIRLRTGHDFSNYKRLTLLRRIERRISLHNLPSLEAYVNLLQKHPEETGALLKDLLISVTNFFRDRKPFEALELEVIPVIVKRKQAGEEVRIWIAGCATGEEAYSIAMLCSERVQDVIDAPKIQIFATDIDADAIAHARDGLYTINDAADISPERLRQFFNKEGEGYRVRREIREMVLFANHNFLKDPPFSDLDLVSCRNVLIYLNRSAQERVMETFHFALNDRGYLFLGSSESVDSGGSLYEPVSRDHHIFKSRPTAARAYPIPDSVPFFRMKAPQEVSIKERSARLLERITYGELHQRLLEQYAPPSLIINQDYDVVHLSEKAALYTRFPAGEPSQNILKVINPDLRLDLRAALYQAIQQKTNVEAMGIPVKIEDQTEKVNLYVKPILSDDELTRGFILIIFEKINDHSLEKTVVLRSDESVSRHLEDELNQFKTQLTASNEHHEFQAEELKASNEELQAMNEELRSSAEELETSKEELQSINEELRTVNQELKVKVDETSINYNNLQNLINSTSIGTIFLDRSFRIAMFTPAIREIFNLIPADLGRPLSDITHRLIYDNLLADVERVLENLTVIEQEVAATAGRFFIMRLSPYRTSQDHINGVVITFIDISSRKEIEKSLRQSQEIYRTVLSSIDEGFCILEFSVTENNDFSGAEYIDANEAFLKYAGLSASVIGQKLDRNGIEEFGDLEIFKNVAVTGKSVRMEFESGRPLSRKWFEAYAIRIGDPPKYQVAIFYNNITDHKYRELNAAFLVEVNDDFNSAGSTTDIVYRVVEKMRLYFAVSWITFAEVNEDKNEVTFINSNEKPASERSSATHKLSDYASEEWLGLARSGQIIVIDDVASDARTMSRAAEFKTTKVAAQLIAPFALNQRLHFIIALHSSIICNWRNDQIELLKELAPRIYQRIERVRAEDELQRSEQRLKKAFSIETVGVVFFKPDGTITGANDAFLKMMRYTRHLLDSGQINWKALTATDEMPQWLCIMDEFLSHGRTTPHEKQYIRKDGTKVWVLVSITKISEEEAVEFIVDISEQKLLQQQKDEFIAIASHELKTPVTSIKVYAEVLQETFEKANDQKNADLIGKLDGQLNRLASLINDLLDTSRMSEGRLQLDIEKFDLNKLIADHVEELQRISHKHQLLFIQGNIRLVHADKERISQVLTNLLSNAIKYSPAGGEILISSEEDGEGARVRVKDHGIGIKEVLIDTVFERFFRITNPQIQSYPGMGLGLYISTAIIKRHGGTMDVKSKENEGSSFYFTLPYNQPMNEEDINS